MDKMDKMDKIAKVSSTNVAASVRIKIENVRFKQVSNQPGADSNLLPNPLTTDAPPAIH